MRLIDADNLVKDVHEEWDPVCIWDETGDATACEIERLIDAQPTVDLWHYPSKGELPEKDGEYLCRYYKYDLRFSKLAHYRVEDNKWYHLIYDEEYRMPKPDAWQYIVPPKEEV